MDLVEIQVIERNKTFTIFMYEGVKYRLMSSYIDVTANGFKVNLFYINQVAERLS